MGAPRVGISACLLGQKVRHDGGHKKAAVILRALSARVEFVPVCPELELGLGVPREPIRLERGPRGVRLRAVKTGRDLTDAMTRFARKRAADLMARGLSGFILKSNSPSCGAARVKVRSPGGEVDESGRGFFARALMEADSLLPVVEDIGLRDARACDRFLKRVSNYDRLKGLPIVIPACFRPESGA